MNSKIIERLLFLILVGLLIFSFIKKRELPNYSTFPEVTRLDPIQTDTLREPFFETAEDGRKHEVLPLFDYIIAGMVVSGGHSKTISNYYQDKLNVMDVGIIWGENLNPEIYRKVKFYTNGVRLYFHTKDSIAYNAINKDKVSNNHLLSIDPELKKSLKKLQRGDIIVLEGFLASYGGRTSSTVRTDTGDGACEVLWVDNINILQSSRSTIWSVLFRFTRNIICLWTVITVGKFLFAPIRSNKKNKTHSLGDKSA